MKKLLTGVFMLTTLCAFAQPWKTIKGNGNVKTESREVANFSSLSARGSMDVQISYGNSNSIKVEADENILPYIETTVENGTLTVKPKDRVNLKSRSKIVVYVQMSKINSLQLSGSGNITSTGNFSNEDETEMKVSGSGNINFNSGDFKELDLELSGSGNINIKKGTSKKIEIEISGSGNINCSDLVAENIEAKISGSGNVRVTANKSIEAKISGSGNVFYKGTATNIISKTSGSGKVIKM